MCGFLRIVVWVCVCVYVSVIILDLYSFIIYRLNDQRSKTVDTVQKVMYRNYYIDTS